MSKKVLKHRHCFRMQGKDINGKLVIYKSWAVVKQPPKGTLVDLVLKAEHVKKSMELHGIGDTQTCSMAVCTVSNGELFPHPVIGVVDWYYSTAYIASKRNKAGYPVECYRYIHGDEIAELNDSLKGQKKLLKWLKKVGDQVIRLRARHRKDKTKLGGTGKRDGTRSGVSGLRGAKLRAATVQLGYIPMNDPAVLAAVAKAKQV